ncbi:MAG: hypothetical protein P8Y51_09925, partial [Campylobacterales bacterium]
MHLTMPIITVSIAMVDFLYFYYRWHVSQYKHDRKNALNRMLERSMAPALWTSVITALGLGSLVFIDSDIVRLLSLSVIFSSIVGYIINLTFLPALLSYFELEHTHVPYAKLGLLLASSELHYSKKFLYVFLGITFALIALGGYMIYGKSNTFFELNVKNDQIELKIPYERIDMELIRSIDRFTEDLRGQFEDDLGEVTSLSSIVKSLNASNTQTDTLDEEALLQALFYLDLYGLSEKYVDGNGVNIRINLFDINKIELNDDLRRAGFGCDDPFCIQVFQGKVFRQKPETCTGKDVFLRGDPGHHRFGDPDPDVRRALVCTGAHAAAHRYLQCHVDIYFAADGYVCAAGHAALYRPVRSGENVFGKIGLKMRWYRVRIKWDRLLNYIPHSLRKKCRLSFFAFGDCANMFQK